MRFVCHAVDERPCSKAVHSIALIFHCTTPPKLNYRMSIAPTSLTTYHNALYQRGAGYRKEFPPQVYRQPT
ncbi:hypothetical protein CDAR_86151 [Caerostris darwini]|uniref:Uncharacterized protein n=1 Tax=Caerostris darwini TaxID=1538125 RepID=A0AAV4SUD7_9ARAC|nr:hypothetical protein CDAR_86151 [Caerostris darwini]